jgi:hypothetical protein
MHDCKYGSIMHAPFVQKEYRYLSGLTIRLIQIFYINIIYFVMTYFIIRDTLIIIYLFYNLYKIFE